MSTSSWKADDAGRARGLALMNGLRRSQVTADVRAAIDVLASRPDCAAPAGAAFFGMSAGAHIGYFAATQVPLSALIALYPGWLTEAGTALSQAGPIMELTPELARHGTPVLLEVGTDDFLFGPGELDQIRAALAGAGARHEVITYPRTPHGFFNPERDTYRPAAAADAWARALALLDATAATGVG